MSINVLTAMQYVEAMGVEVDDDEFTNVPDWAFGWDAFAEWVANDLISRRDLVAGDFSSSAKRITITDNRVDTHVLDRAPSEDELAWWTADLDSGDWVFDDPCVVIERDHRKPKARKEVLHYSVGANLRWLDHCRDRAKAGDFSIYFNRTEWKRYAKRLTNKRRRQAMKELEYSFKADNWLLD